MFCFDQWQQSYAGLSASAPSGASAQLLQRLEVFGGPSAGALAIQVLPQIG